MPWLTLLVPTLFVGSLRCQEHGRARADAWKPAASTLRFFEKHVIVDGNVSFPSTRAKELAPKLSGKDWGRWVKKTTGLDLGNLTIGSEAGFLQTAKFLREKTRPGLRSILYKEDLARVGDVDAWYVLLYFQTHPRMRGDVDRIRFWHEKGLRVFQPAYGSKTNQEPLEKLAGGSEEETGLTKLGREAVRTCFDLGMVVDVSHCSETSQIEVAGLAAARGIPVTANHTCCRDLKREDGSRVADYKRNITDAAMKAIAKTDGVVGIMAYRPYLRRRGTGTLDTYLDHVEHAIAIAGIDHVGISTDGYLDGAMVRDQTADGKLDHPQRWMIVYEGLRARGWKDPDLARLFGSNLMRVYEKVLPRAGQKAKRPARK